MSHSSFTVQTWIARSARWTARMNRGVTTRRRPACSGTWNARYGTRPGDRPAHERRVDARRGHELGDLDRFVRHVRDAQRAGPEDDRRE